MPVPAPLVPVRSVLVVNWSGRRLALGRASVIDCWNGWVCRLRSRARGIQGRYCVQLYKDGDWAYVYVDDRIPCNRASQVLAPARVACVC